MLRAVRSVHADPAWQPTFDAVWDCSGVTAHVVLPEEIPPLVEEEATASGRDVLIESPVAGESALSQMLAAFCRRRGKDMTVYMTLEDGLRALGRDALPAALQATR